MTKDGQLDFLDLISIASFVIALMNLEENVTQGDKQELMAELGNKADMMLKEIHAHLEVQDQKIDLILEGIRNDDRRDF